jgi:hypothetical protein
MGHGDRFGWEEVEKMIDDIEIGRYGGKLVASDLVVKVKDMTFHAGALCGVVRS